MNIYQQAIENIIQAQQEIIGPIAFDQARKVAGVQIGLDGQVKITGDGKDVLKSLVGKYSQFFGQASIEVCKDAIRDIKAAIPSQDLPDVLR